MRRQKPPRGKRRRSHRLSRPQPGQLEAAQLPRRPPPRASLRRATSQQRDLASSPASANGRLCTTAEVYRSAAGPRPFRQPVRRGRHGRRMTSCAAWRRAKWSLGGMLPADSVQAHPRKAATSRRSRYKNAHRPGEERRHGAAGPEGTAVSAVGLRAARDGTLGLQHTARRNGKRRTHRLRNLARNYWSCRPPVLRNSAVSRAAELPQGRAASVHTVADVSRSRDWRGGSRSWGRGV